VRVGGRHQGRESKRCGFLFVFYVEKLLLSFMVSFVQRLSQQGAGNQLLEALSEKRKPDIEQVLDRVHLANLCTINEGQALQQRNKQKDQKPNQEIKQSTWTKLVKASKMYDDVLVVPGDEAAEFGRCDAEFVLLREALKLFAQHIEEDRKSLQAKAATMQKADSAAGDPVAVNELLVKRAQNAALSALMMVNVDEIQLKEVRSKTGERQQLIYCIEKKAKAEPKAEADTHN